MKQLPLREGDRVRAPDCTLPGRIKDTFDKDGRRWFKVAFPMGSPFIDDWTLYESIELEHWKEKPPAEEPLSPARKTVGTT